MDHLAGHTSPNEAPTGVRVSYDTNFCKGLSSGTNLLNCGLHAKSHCTDLRASKGNTLPRVTRPSRPVVTLRLD